jgi:hypothetical protein
VFSIHRSKIAPVLVGACNWPGTQTAIATKQQQQQTNKKKKKKNKKNLKNINNKNPKKPIFPFRISESYEQKEAERSSFNHKR